MTLDDLTLATYKQRLEDACAGAVERMIKNDKDDGRAILHRSQSYRPVVQAVLKVLTKENILQFDP